MSTAENTAPESVDPTSPTKPPFYRRPLVLIIAGTVVLVLIVGGAIAFVAGSAAPVAHRDAASTTTTHPTPTRRSAPTSTPTLTPTATPTVSAVQPQAGAPAKPPAAPPAAVAPVAPAPAPPVTAGPGRTSGPTNVTITGQPVTVCPTTGIGPGVYFTVTITWGSAGGTKWLLKDTEDDTYYTSPGLPVAASGSKTVDQPCLGPEDNYTFTVSTSGIGGKTVSTSTTVKTTY